MPKPKLSPLYEINTPVYLNRLSAKFNKPISLANIPQTELLKLQGIGIKSVWLMGIWDRSPSSIAITKADKVFMAHARTVLPDYSHKDLIGSAYSVRSYSVSKAFGGVKALKKLRRDLNKLDIKLILDFIPNHVGIDHDWVSERPEFYITRGLKDRPLVKDAYIEIHGRLYAKGRDPTFEPWSDVLQLNAFSPNYRQQSISTLLEIAEICDGVRCDMALLLINKIFANTWGELAGSVPNKEYWSEVISQVHLDEPEFQFIAETYWGTEAQLIKLGFDYCYDKTLRDYLFEGRSEQINRYLIKTTDLRLKLLTFIDNHDEARAASVLSPKEELAAAAVSLTLPGLALIYDGQLEGHKVRLPVHLGREPIEELNKNLELAYSNLLSVIKDWRVAECQYEHLRSGHEQVLAWCLKNKGAVHLVVINYSALKSRARILLGPLKADLDTTKLTNRLKPDQALKTQVSKNKRSVDFELKPWEVLLLDLS